REPVGGRGVRRRRDAHCPGGPVDAPVRTRSAPDRPGPGPRGGGRAGRYDRAAATTLGEPSMTSDSERVQTRTVLLYSDDAEVRAAMRQAIGTRPAPDLSVRFVEAATHDEVVRLVDNQDFDLLVLDGEAAPSGGMGISRQLKDEIDDCPPICVVIARAADRWLAAY